MRKVLVALLALSISGCGGCGDWAKKKVGIPTEAEIKAQEAEKVKEADTLVQTWADKLNGAPRHEGVTEADPWGNFVKVEYKQEWATETMTVRSAGPDGAFGNQDDLVRVRTTSRPEAISQGVPQWVVIVGGWVVLGFLASIMASGLNRKRRRVVSAAAHRDHPLTFTFFVMVLAPLAFVFYAFVGVANLLGSVLGDQDFALNFDFDIDLDIDL